MITIIEVAGALVVFVAAALAVTQVLFPLRRNTPLFPLFRTKEALLRAEQAHVVEEVVESEIRKETAKIRSRITHPAEHDISKKEGDT